MAKTEKITSGAPGGAVSEDVREPLEIVYVRQRQERSDVIQTWVRKRKWQLRKGKVHPLLIHPQMQEKGLFDNFLSKGLGLMHVFD